MMMMMMMMMMMIITAMADDGDDDGDDEDNFSGGRWDGITDACQTSLSSDLPLIKFQPSRPVASHIGGLAQKRGGWLAKI